MEQFSIICDKLSVGKKYNFPVSFLAECLCLVASCLPAFANITRSKIIVVGQFFCLPAVLRTCPTRFVQGLILSNVLSWWSPKQSALEAWLWPLFPYFFPASPSSLFSPMSLIVSNLSHLPPSSFFLSQFPLLNRSVSSISQTPCYQ